MIAPDTSQDSPEPSADQSAEAMQPNPGIRESNPTSANEDSVTPEPAPIENAEASDTHAGDHVRVEAQCPEPVPDSSERINEAEEACAIPTADEGPIAGQGGLEHAEPGIPVSEKVTTAPTAASPDLGEDPPLETHSQELPDLTPASQVSTAAPDHLPQEAVQSPPPTAPPGNAPGEAPTEQDTAEEPLTEEAEEEKSATPEPAQAIGNPTTPPSVSADSGSVPKPWAKEKTAQNGYPEELNNGLKELRQWNSQHAWFVGGLKATIWLIEDLLSRSEQSQKLWPAELGEKLKSRHQGLVLTGKILRRSSEKCDCLSLLGEGAFPNIEMDPVYDSQWEETLSELQGSESAPNFDLLHQHFNATRDAVLTGIHKSTVQDQKKLIALVQKSVLPVIDGLDDGEMGTQSLIDSLIINFPQHSDSLKEWFGTYPKMRSTLLELLAGVGIEKMHVEFHTPVDYERHEPFDVEESLEFDDESILSISRNGYEFPKEEGVPWQIVRPAQVIVAQKPREPSN